MITGIYGQPVCKEFAGLSTDAKPTEDVLENSLFLELDTKKFYYFSGGDWVELGEEPAEEIEVI